MTKPRFPRTPMLTKKLYLGTPHRLGSRVVVHVPDPKGTGIVRPLSPRHDLIKYSKRFDWGRLSNGCAQLALALLADAFNDDELALRHHDSFKLRQVALWTPDKPWSITKAAIKAMKLDDYADTHRQ
jgi:hypothetical protein